MTQHESVDLCGDISEHWAAVLDGNADPKWAAHLAECDGCRDVRHELEAVTRTVSAAGQGYALSSSFEERLLVEAERMVASGSVGAVYRQEVPPVSEPTEYSGIRATQTNAEPEASARASEPAAGARRTESEMGEASVARLDGPGASLWVRFGLVAAAAAVLVLASLARPERPGIAVGGQGWSGRVTRLIGTSGAPVLVCTAEDDCQNVDEGAIVPPGGVIKTGTHARVEIELSDKSHIALEKNSVLKLLASEARAAELREGALVADIEHQATSRARFEVAQGSVSVLGTKFALEVSRAESAVSVSRGTVELVTDGGTRTKVRAGEKGRLVHGARPEVGEAADLSDALAWSEQSFARDEAPPARGLGELRARKPGGAEELRGAVTLTSHEVRVRVAGAMARTEIEEVFTNTTDDVLEGIYRFPLPAGAQVERLLLDVDGKLEEGAFVDRDRAASIWRGALANAAPKERRPREEIVWVPGPWKDPAILEWQRGGRFELKIFPIPKRGFRRVVLAYTEITKPSLQSRRYSYPLAYDPTGTTRVGKFKLDVEVRGHDAPYGVRSTGYALAAEAKAGVDALHYEATDFSPSGDLTLDYALPERGAELMAWSFRDRTDVAQPGLAAAGGPGATSRLVDPRPYVALALRPTLPRTSGTVATTMALVIDSSRSMFGENYARMRTLAARVIAELADEDKVLVLACDSRCAVMPGGLHAGGRATAGRLDAFLGARTPDGASDLSLALAEAAKALRAAGTSSGQVVYLGDGTPTLGPTRPKTLEHAVKGLFDGAGFGLTLVAVGSDSDVDSLRALARAGRGTVVPFVPGQTSTEAAFSLLSALRSSRLRNVEVELPPGFQTEAPVEAGTLLGGEELWVSGRIDGAELRGAVTLRGEIDGQPFERKYPLELSVSESQGNAFVPRLVAAHAIAALERAGTRAAKERAIELSSRYHVASRYTSLLVLESPAMMHAFGLKTERAVTPWSGDEAAEGVASMVEASRLERDAEAESAADDEAPAFKKSKDDALAPRRAAPQAFDFGPGSGVAGANRMGVPDVSQRRRPRTWVPMRRIWERKGRISTDRTAPRAASSAAIADLSHTLAQGELQRSRVQRLYQLLSAAGDVDEAARVAEQWAEKEPLDPDALRARADVAARSGDRELAIRRLGSVLDVRPGDVSALERLARLHRWSERPLEGCRYSVAAAEIKPDDVQVVAQAVRCTREAGEGAFAEALLRAASETTRSAVEVVLAREDAAVSPPRGDLRVEATWNDGDTDLDLGLVDTEGHRVSFLGAPTRAVIHATDVTSTSGEALSLRGAKPGEYAIELVRVTGSEPVHGELLVIAADQRRRIPFTFDGARLQLGVAEIRMESRLVPVEGMEPRVFE